MSGTHDVAAYVQAARDAARAAGSILLGRFRADRAPAVETKSRHDYVTEVDRAAERAIVGILQERFPEHAVMAEEGSPHQERGSFRWIIDPLDGTTNFIHGVATFCVSIALEDPEGLRVAAVYDPCHEELFEAVRGRGARLNGEPVACSTHRDLGPCLLATGFPFRMFGKIDGYLHALRSFMTRTSGIRRAGSAALDLAFTACGRYDGFWETGLSPWDMAAGALLVTEAGGVVTDFAGQARFLEAGEIVAAGAGIHREMLHVVREHLASA